MRDSSLKVRQLGRMPLVVCASPDYLEANDQPAHPSELANHTCLIDENPSDATAWTFRQGTRNFHVKVSGTFHANAPAAIANMAIAGLGIGRCPHYAVAQSLADKTLTQLFPEFETESYGLYALYPASRHLTARVRALIDHLAKSFGPLGVVQPSEIQPKIDRAV